MKHAPKPPRSITAIKVPGLVESMDIVGPFKVKSIQKSSYGQAFIKHYTNTPFFYGLKK